jgi:hypothetical protein
VKFCLILNQYENNYRAIADAPEHLYRRQIPIAGHGTLHLLGRYVVLLNSC